MIFGRGDQLLSSIMLRMTLKTPSQPAVLTNTCLLSRSVSIAFEYSLGPLVTLSSNSFGLGQKTAPKNDKTAESYLSHSRNILNIKLRISCCYLQVTMAV